MRFRQWFEPPRHVLTIFIVVAVLSAGALGWLGVLLWQQDNAVEAQRRRERLEEVADRAVAVMQRGLSELETQLGPAAERRSIPRGVTLVASDAAQTVVQAGPGLLYYPTAPHLPEAPAVVFAQAERLEFAADDPLAASRAYAALARSADAPLRAGALTRLARASRKMRDVFAAERAYKNLSGIRAAVGGLPAGIIAREGLAGLLSDARATDHLRRHAEAFYAELRAGTWQLTKEQYEFYRSEVDVWLGRRTHDDPEALARAEAFDRVWRSATADKAVSRRVSQARETPVLALWRRDSDRLYVAIAGREYLAGLCREAAPGLDTRLALTDLEGQPVVGSASTREAAVRTAASMGLPWTVHIASAGTAEPRASRRGLLLGIYALLAGVIIAGAYFIHRAISRELRVAVFQSDFVAAVSHEFRSPLSSLAQISEMLERDRFPSDELRRRSYEVLTRETDRLRRLVESLLDFGRLEAGAESYRFETINVVAFARSVVADFQDRVSAQGVVVELRAAAGELLIRGDCEALSRAMLNLLDNAVKYSPHCHTVWVDVEEDSGLVAISVRDQGLGIPAHEQRAVFNRFVRGAQSKEMRIKGTGIGLAMVRNIVRAHGGEIRLASETGRGSCFTMLLRAAGGAS